MSDNVLSVIPTDPRWQPGQAEAEHARDLTARLTPERADQIEVMWHEAISVIDCGDNLQTIACPHCGGDIDTEWWADLLEERCEEGFDDLSAVVPCCDRRTDLNSLNYDWQCGFARFEIAIWNPQRDWFTDPEAAMIAEALGHPIRQVMAHV